MTIDEIMQQVNEIEQKLKDDRDQLELLINDLKKDIEQNTNFNKRLIKALSACEDANNLTLLPSGTYYGEKID